MRIQPGQTALTRMPCGPSSSASERVRPDDGVLAGGIGRKTGDAGFAPDGRLVDHAGARGHERQDRLRQAHHAHHVVVEQAGPAVVASGEPSVSGVGYSAPALLTNTSSWPQRSRTCEATAATSSALPRSHRPPRLRVRWPVRAGRAGAVEQQQPGALCGKGLCQPYQCRRPRP